MSKKMSDAELGKITGAGTVDLSQNSSGGAHQGDSTSIGGDAGGGGKTPPPGGGSSGGSGGGGTPINPDTTVDTFGQ